MVFKIDTNFVVMKRLFALLMAVMYTISSIGMTVSTHYCAGKAMTCKCTKPKAGKKDHCCKDTVTYLKSQEAHQFQEAGDFKKQQAISIALPVSFYQLADCKTFQNSQCANFNTAASVLNGPPLYELFCVYRV